MSDSATEETVKRVKIGLTLGEWEDIVDACSTWERDYAMPEDGDWPGRDDRRSAIARLRGQVRDALHEEKGT